MNLPSSLFPSIDLSYIEDKYSGFSTQALLNAWSSLKGNTDNSARYVSNAEEAKVRSFSFSHTWAVHMGLILLLGYSVIYIILVILMSRNCFAFSTYVPL